MNKILIINLLMLFLYFQAKAQTKSKKHFIATDIAKKSPYSLSLQAGGMMNIAGENMGLQLSTALDYQAMSWLGFRTHFFGYAFTANPNNFSYMIHLPPDISEGYSLSFAEKNRHFFWTIGPVFQIGKKWQWSVAPQAGVKGSFVTFNTSESGILAEVRTFKADYNWVYGFETQLWYQINPFLSLGIGLDGYKHKMQYQIQKATALGKDISNTTVQNYIREITNPKTKQFVALNLGLKYQF